MTRRGYPRSRKPPFSDGLDDAPMPRAAMTAKDAGQPVQPERLAIDADRHLPVEASSPPVILSKVRIPRQRPVTLGRGRLLGWLDQHAGDRVVVVAAEVGYGKSTLLADYARRSGARCVWYRVEESDGDWILLHRPHGCGDPGGKAWVRHVVGGPAPTCRGRRVTS